jgi:hypothetical protein
MDKTSLINEDLDDQKNEQATSSYTPILSPSSISNTSRSIQPSSIHQNRVFRDLITQNGRQAIQTTYPYIKEQACALREPFRKEAKQGSQLLQELCNETKEFLPTHRQPETLMDLLEFMLDRDIITKERMVDIDKIMSFFPDISEKTDRRTLTRPYIFEGLWKIVFLLEQDGMFSDKKRTFKQKLEHPRPGRDISVSEYLFKKINGGNESGIADLMFTLSDKPEEKKDEMPENQTRSPCDTDYRMPTGEAILISSKYYQKEHGINKYDVNELITEAKKEKSGGSGGYKVDEFSIIVLVKDKVAFKKILDATHEKEVVNYLSYKHILDVSDLQEGLTRLYFYLKEKGINITNVRASAWYDKISESKPYILSQLRFHQDYIVTYTDSKINEGGSKFIWGAVPRSGKSFMVGGLIAKRLPRYVILILGAISETKEQFIKDVFKKYRELEVYYKKNEYDHIIDMQKLNHNDRKTKIEAAVMDTTGHYIFVYSQELLREHIKNYDDYQSTIGQRPVLTFEIKELRSQKQAELILKKKSVDDIKLKKSLLATEVERKKLLAKFEEKENKELKKIEAEIEALDGTLLVRLMEPIFKSEPYVFFDEVQQGSGYANVKNQQDGILHHLFPKGYLGVTPKLVLVTATYAKPLLKYNENLNGEPIHLISWSYENNNVRMKQFDAHELSEFIEDDKDRSKKLELLQTLVKEWEERGMTRTKIAQQYMNYPELVLLSPETIKFDNPLLIHQNSDKYSDVHIGDINVNELFKKNKTGFVHSNYVDKLLEYICHQYESLRIQYHVNFRGTDSRTKFHSQLWFLPTTIRSDKEDIDTEVDGPNSFADTAEFLAKQICENSLFEDFNVAIVHSLKSKSRIEETDERHTKTGTIRRLSSEKRIFLCNHDDDKNDIKTLLKEVEIQSHNEHKSLIILTGKRLRLGISLNCVDLAIHLDPITSVDTLYQSMFRVLTERKGKERGYVIDLLPHRAIKFVYEICEYTGDRKVTMERVKQALYLFNVNFIRKLALRPDHHGSSMYKKLMEAFHIDNTEKFISYQDTIFNTRIDQIKRNFKKAISSLNTEEKSHIKKLMTKLLKFSKDKAPKGKTETVKQGERPTRPPPDIDSDSDSESEQDTDELKSSDIESLFKKLTFLFSLFVLYHSNATLPGFYYEYKNAINQPQFTHEAIELCDEINIDLNTIHACFVKYQLAMKKNEKKTGEPTELDDESTVESKETKDIWQEMSSISIEQIRSYMTKYANLVENMYRVTPLTIQELFDTTQTHMENNVISQKANTETDLFSSTSSSISGSSISGSRSGSSSGGSSSSSSSRSGSISGSSELKEKLQLELNALIHQKSQLEKKRQLDEDEDSKDEAPQPTPEEILLQTQIDKLKEQLRELDNPISTKHAPRVLQPEILEQKAVEANPGEKPREIKCQIGLKWDDMKKYAKSAGVDTKLNKDELCKALSEKGPFIHRGELVIVIYEPPKLAEKKGIRLTHKKRRTRRRKIRRSNLKSR